MATAFDTKIRTSYAATGCTYLSYGCAHGWHHVNTDWAVLEPVAPTTGRPRRASDPTRC
ncbi:MAG TPA: hypothetical protein VGX25_33060 [Actinophytocola sp.]|uniref:hypothetical protein n=1 Tax=Actinophytocola sp. TaxID=1872138 RepID=UPI002DDD0224|nr:hypothetical protein [Actinophytocola sp.]HEV2784241.1 hypothetical protein [Actinophytocola sp.]